MERFVGGGKWRLSIATKEGAKKLAHERLWTGGVRDELGQRVGEVLTLAVWKADLGMVVEGAEEM